MTVNDTDTFLVNRNNTSYNIESQNLMAELQDTDLMLVNRSGKSYKATGAEIKDSLGPKGVPNTPHIECPANLAGMEISAESDEIIKKEDSELLYSSSPPLDPSNDPGALNGWGLAFNGDLTDGAYGPSGGWNMTSLDLSAFNISANNLKIRVKESGSFAFGINSGQAFLGGNIESKDTIDSANKLYEYNVSPSVGQLTSIHTGSQARICGIIVDGVVLIDMAQATTLTLSGNKDLSGDPSFKAGDAVQQDSGHTLETDTITSSATAPFTPMQSYVMYGYKSDAIGIVEDGPDGPGGNGINKVRIVGQPSEQVTVLFGGSPPNFSEAYRYYLIEASTYDFIAPCREVDSTVAAVCAMSEDGINFTQYYSGTFPGQSTPDPRTQSPVAVKYVLYTKNTSITTGDTMQAENYFVSTNSDRPLITTLGLSSNNDLENFRPLDTVSENGSNNDGAGTVNTIDDKAMTLVNSTGNWEVGSKVRGFLTAPATGTVASVDAVTNTIVLSESNTDGFKRWIANQGKFVKGPPSPSKDAAPDVDGLTLYSSAFGSTPAGSLGQTGASWQVAAYDDINFASPIAQELDSTTDLTQWPVIPELAAETQYRCRVRHISGDQESEWSDPSTFKTDSKTTDTLPESDLALWEGSDKTDTTAINIPGGVKLINAASNYSDQVGYGVNNHIYRIHPTTVAVTDLGAFGPAMIGPDGKEEQIATGLIGYNGNGGMITQEGDLYFFGTSGLLPDPNGPKTHLLNAKADGGSGSSNTSDVCVAYSNKLQKVYGGYIGATSYIIGTWSGTTGDGWQEEPGLNQQFFDPNPGKQIVQVTMTNNGGANYQYANHLYVLYEDGKIAYNGTLTNVTDAKQMFILNRSKNISILMNNGDLYNAAGGSATLTLTQIGQNEKFITAAAGSPTGAVALGDDYQWYRVNPNNGTHRAPMTDPSGDPFTASVNVKTSNFHNWGSAVSHANNLKLTIPIT